MMESRPRADIYINLPALRKLDSMLMVIYIIRKMYMIVRSDYESYIITSVF